MERNLEVPHEKLLRVNFEVFKQYRVCDCTRTSFSSPLTAHVKLILLFLWRDTSFTSGKSCDGLR